ncbi:sciellin isoform X2 [Antennarius striatus]|uniref:sciellin isoform X2 n=1 Tax=Antennarius striatus TaxID=241820 RepID=UPI0035B2493B
MSSRYVPKYNTESSWITVKTNDDEDNSLVDDANTTTRPTSVKALTQRFSSLQDEPPSSTYSSNRSTSTTKSTTTRVTKDGTTETTVTTTTKNLGSPTKFSERVLSSSQGPQYSSYSPTRTTKVTDTSITSNEDASNKLYDTLLPSSIKDPSSSTTSSSTKLTEITVTGNKNADRFSDQDLTSTIKDILSPTHRIVSSTETVTVKGSPETQSSYSPYSSSRTTKVTERIISTGSEDITDAPSSLKYEWTPTDSQRLVTSTETVTVKSSPDNKPVDDLYGTLLPKGITSDLSSDSIRRREIVTVNSSRGGESPTYPLSSSTKRTSSYSSYDESIPTSRITTYSVSSTPSDDYSREKSNSLSRTTTSYDYSSISSPTLFTPTSSFKSSSMSDDILADPLSKSSSESVYAPAQRTMLERDLCTSCHTPFNGDAKMLLDDLNVKCHASCFKCEVCNSTLGNLKAGDTVWIYRHMVHCENCFEITREKWRR